jgi:hypothetical protein
MLSTEQKRKEEIMIRRKISSTLKLGLFCVIFGGLTLQGQGFVPSDNEMKLDEILRNVAEYCERLDHSVLDFICLENIEERFYKIPRYSKKTSAFKLNTYTYDFQLIKKGEEIKETRRLLKKNGEDLDGKITELQTDLFKYGKITIASIRLLGKSRQPNFKYKILQESDFNDQKVWIIDIMPKKPSLSLYGKAWIRQNDYAVVKIEWVPESIVNFDYLKVKANQMKAKCRLNLMSEYAFEKNGLCFPSKFIIEEAYIKKYKKYVLSKLDVTYRNYKFFVVETQVKYKN